MAETRVVEQSIAHDGISVNGDSMLRYMKLRMYLNFAVWIGYGIVLSIVYSPSGYVERLDAVLVQGMSDPISWVISLILGIGIWFVIETIVIGAIAGWYVFGDAKAGMIPIWRAPKVVSLYA